MQVGVTRERHRTIRAVLDNYEVHKRITWRGDLNFLRGTHAYEVHEAGSGRTLVRHVLHINLAWWFSPVWWLYVSRIHDRLVEGLLDRLADGATPAHADSYALLDRTTSQL